MNGIVAQVSQEIINAIKNDSLVLPTLPEVALRVRDEAENPESNLNSLGKIISSDPALSASIIKVANNTFFRTAHDIIDLKMALMRLGMKYASNIAIGLAMKQMFQATCSIVDRRMRETWKQSSEIAGICHMLSQRQPGLQSEQATLGGLVHQIGILPILTFAEENAVLLKDSFSLDAVIKKLHPAIGKAILKKWDFPEELVSVPVNYLKFDRNISAADYADLVTVATLQSHMGDDSEMANVDYASVKAFARLGLQADSHIESEDLSEEMQEAMRMLG